jgi:type I restriction enzyme S subunit
VSAVLTAQEPSAKYLVNLQPPLVRHFDLIAQAPGGVARLRELILTLAVQGKLVPQDPSDEPASELLKKIRAEKDRLIADGKIKRDKPLAQIADEEKPFELPTGWAWERFGAIAGIERGGSPRPIESFLTDDPSGLNWIKIGDTEKGGKYITSASQKIKREGLVKTRMVYPGDFLLTNSMSFGRPYITQIEGCIHDGWLRISPPSSLDKDFLYALLSSRFIRTVFEAAAAGAVVLNLNADKVRTVPIPLPPLAEQSRIVARVEELMQLCDALEAQGQLEAEQHARLVSTLFGSLLQSDTPEALADNWQRIATHFDVLLDRPEAVDALEQTILQLAVRGLLVPQDPTDEPASVLLQKIRTEKDHLIAQGKIKRDKPLPPITDEEKPFELPQGWQLTRLGASIELISGQHLGPDEYVEGLDGGIPYLTGPAEFGVESPSPTRSTKETRAVASSGDILITVKGSGVGKLNVVRHPEIAISRQLMAIRPLGVNFDFVLLVLKTMGLKFQAQAVGIAIPGIGREDVAGSLVALPPFAEQLRIVTRVNEIRGLCAGLRQSLASVQTAQLLISNVLIGSFNNFLNPTETNGLSN